MADQSTPLLPSYSSHIKSSTADIPKVIRHVRPGNYLNIRRTRKAIEGTYVIDPLWEPNIPSYMLPPVRAWESRQNVVLNSEGGHIIADLWIRPGSAGVVPAERAKTRKLTLLEMTSKSESINVKVHASPEDPFSLTCTSKSHITVYLPRTYTGLFIALTQSGVVRFSPAVTARMTVFTEVDGTQHCLIGSDLGDEVSRNVEQGQGHGSELHLSTDKGHIMVAFLDEEPHVVVRMMWRIYATLRVSPTVCFVVSMWLLLCMLYGVYVYLFA